MSPAAKLRSGQSALLGTTCGALCASGMAGLAFESLWFRQARLAFGSSHWAAAVVTAAFMLGLGIGGWVSSRLDRFGLSPRHALWLCAALELWIAAVGLLLVYLLPVVSTWQAPLDAALVDSPWLVQALRLTSAEALLVWPTCAMGSTLPLAVHGLRSRQHERRGGMKIGFCYGANTLGAVGGALWCEVFLIERIGVSASAWTTAGMSLLAALLFFVGGRHSVREGFGEQAVDDAAKPEGAASSLAASPWVAARILGLAGVVGFAMLALQAVWLRLMSLFLSDTPLSFAVVLAVLLSSLSLGSWAAGLWLRRDEAAYRHAPLLAMGCGLAVVAGVRLLPRALVAFFSLESDFGTVAPIAATLLFGAGLCSGALFALLVAARASAVGGLRATGEVTAANSFGAALGALLGAVLLLPELGMQGALLLLSCLLIVASPLAAERLRPRGAAVWGVALATCVAVFPYGTIERSFIRGSVGRWMTPDDRIVAVREGLGATLVHVEHREHGVPIFDQLATNAYSMSANDFAARRYMKLFAYLPLALHPGMERALAIGYGLGSTVKALTDDEGLREIVVVDVSPETLAIGRTLSFPDGDDPLEDPRVRTILDDGRHFLAGGGAGFDLITGEPPPPFLAGVENLYSREYFSLVRERLSEGGFATYWLPLMNISHRAALSIVAGFCEVFDDCSLWHGSGENFILLGSRGFSGPAGDGRLTALWTRPSVRRELTRIGLEHPVQLGPLFIGDAGFLAELVDGVAPLTDDFPHRIRQSSGPEARRRLLTSLRDTDAARRRFLTSPFIEQAFPERARRAMAGQFEHQRLVNELLFPGPSGAYDASVLQQVLEQTPWTFPVVLLAGSDPDVQEALSDRRLASATGAPPPNRHQLAAALARRDRSRAVQILRQLPDDKHVLPGLTQALGAEPAGR